MRNLTKNTLCSNIVLPHLGNIYLKYNNLCSYVNNTFNSFLGIEVNKDRLKLFNEKKNLMIGYYRSEHPSRRAFIKNFMGSLITKMKRQIKKDGVLGTIDQIEKIQKDYYEKTKQNKNSGRR